MEDQMEKLEKDNQVKTTELIPPCNKKVGFNVKRDRLLSAFHQFRMVYDSFANRCSVIGKIMTLYVNHIECSTKEKNHLPADEKKIQELQELVWRSSNEYTVLVKDFNIVTEELRDAEKKLRNAENKVKDLENQLDVVLTTSSAKMKTFETEVQNNLDNMLRKAQTSMRNDLNDLLDSKDKEIQKIRNESELKILELEEKNNQAMRQLKQKCELIKETKQAAEKFEYKFLAAESKLKDSVGILRGTSNPVSQGRSSSQKPPKEDIMPTFSPKFPSAVHSNFNSPVEIKQSLKSCIYNHDQETPTYAPASKRKRVTFSLSDVSDEVTSTPRSEETSTTKPSTATPSYFSFLMNLTKQTQSTPVFSRPKLDKSKDSKENSLN